MRNLLEESLEYRTQTSREVIWNVMDSPLRTHTRLASSWFQRTRLRAEQTSFFRQSPGESLLISKYLSSSSSSLAHRRREAELVQRHSQLQRFIVRVSGWTNSRWCEIRAGFKHTALVIPIVDDGWRPRWDHLLASPCPVLSVRLSFSAAARYWHCCGDVGREGGCYGAPQPNAAPFEGQHVFLSLSFFLSFF